MIVKSTQHGGRIALARHVQRADKNETVEIVGAEGLANGGNVDAALMEMATIAQGSRTKNYLVHAVANPGPDAPMSEEAWDQVWKTYAKQHGLEGHPCVRVRHTKSGWQHEHAIFLAVDPVTLKSARLGHLHQKDEAVSRMLEVDFGHRLTNGVHSKAVAAQCRKQGRGDVSDALGAAGFTGTTPGRGRFTRNEKEAVDRGVPVEVRREQIAAAWRSSTDAASFTAALRAHGLFLAQGDGGKGRGGEPGRAALVAVDTDGNAIPVLRSLKRFDDLADLKKRDLDERIKGLVVRPLAEVKEALVRAQENSAGIDPAQGKRILDGLAEIAPPTDEELGVANFQAERRARLRADPFQSIQAEEPAPYKDAAGRTIYPKRPRAAADAGVFTENDLVKIYRSVGFSKAEAQAEAKKALESAIEKGEVVNLSKLEGGGEPSARYATRSFLLAEVEAADRAQRMRDRHTHQVDQRHIDAAFASRKTLKAGQAAALRAMLGPESLCLVEGYAGAGKSFTLGAACEAWMAQGRNVYGAALSSVASENLRDCGIKDSRTLAAWLIEWKRAEAEPGGRARGLTSRDVVVIDEAAMVGSEQMRDVLRFAEQVGAKVVLVGDARQVQSVDPGAIFKTLARIAPPATIDEVTRQTDDWAKRAVEAFGCGDAGQALRAFDEHGRIVQVEKADQALDAIAARVLEERRDHPGDDFLALAYRRIDVRSINDRVREARIAAGEIEQGVALTVQPGDGVEKRRFAVGDCVIMLGNDKSVETVQPETQSPTANPHAALDQALAKKTGLKSEEKEAPKGVRNGERGEILAIEGTVVTVKLKDRTVRFDTNRYRKFDHGYAVTIHKSQGVTVPRSVLYGDAVTAELAYVGMSRSREAAEVIVSEEKGGKAGFFKRAGTWKPNESALERLEQARLTRREVLTMLSPPDAPSEAPDTRTAIGRFIDQALQGAQTATRAVWQAAKERVVQTIMATGSESVQSMGLLETVEQEVKAQAEAEAKKKTEAEKKAEVRIIFKPAILVERLQQISRLPPEQRAGVWETLAPEILALSPQHAAMLLEEMKRQGMPEKAIERVRDAWVAADPQNRRGQLTNGFVADFLSAGQTAPPAPARRFADGEDQPQAPEQKKEERRAPKLPPAATKPPTVPPASSTGAGASTIRPAVRDAARVAQLRGVLLGTWRSIPPGSATSRLAAIQVANSIGPDAVRNEVAPNLPAHEAEMLRKAADGADTLAAYAKIDRAGGTADAWSRHGHEIEQAVRRLDAGSRARVAAVLLLQGDHLAAAHLDSVAARLVPHERPPSTVAKQHLAGLPEDHRALLYGLAGRDDPTGGDPHNTTTLPGKPGKK